MKEELISFETAKLAKRKGFGDTVDTITLPERPTQSLLQKWLRELDDWSILVYVVPYFSIEPRKEQCFIWRRGVLISLEPENTYEEALEKGLQEALKLIKK